MNNRLPPYITGGYDISAQLAVDGLRARGHEVHALVSNYGLERRTDGRDVSRVLHRVDQTPSPARLLSMAWRDVRAVRAQLRAFEPDIISVWNLSSLFPEVLRELVGFPRPVVFHLHDLWPSWTCEWATEWHLFWSSPSASGWRQLPKRLVAGLLGPLRLADGWPSHPQDVPLRRAVFCSEFERRRYAEAGYREDDWRVILSGTDVDRFTPGPARSERRLRLLFAGRFVEPKGAPQILEAMALLEGRGLDDLELTLVGSIPPDRACYDAMIARCQTNPLRGRVRFEGLVPAEKMAELYRHHDVFVLPTAELEGLPRGVIEAMASGLAVVASPTGGGAEILRDGQNALVVPPRDPDALARALGRLVHDRSLVRSLGDEARRYVVAHHSIARVLDSTEKYYRECVTQQV